MPLHFGKIFGIIALLTILAFVLWQVWIGFFAGETFDKPAALPQAEPPLVQMGRDGASVVAEAAAKADIPLIHLSTDYVFDGASRVPYREDDNVNPQGSYATSKEAGERAVRGSHDRHLILRTAWVYGPFGTNFVKTMLRLGAEREELRVVDDQTGCPTSTEDLAGAILTLAESLEGPGFSGWGHLPLCRRRPDHLVRLRHHDLCRSGKARTQSPASPPARDRRLSDGRAPACLFGARHGKA
jgi:hypothetical protein